MYAACLSLRPIRVQGSQNVLEEKANHEEEAAGEDISVPERQRHGQPREVRGKF